MSTAWYKSRVQPKLLKRFASPIKKTDAPYVDRNRIIEIWNTTCIVTNFGKESIAKSSILINPANQQLSGVSKFPYFPKGGPVPKQLPNKDSHHIMGYVSQWGGMEIGGGMLFASNIVDGLVHQLGGWQLAWNCQSLPNYVPPPTNGKKANDLSPILMDGEDDVKCPIGYAVSTCPGGSELQKHFDQIIHTVPPFYKHHSHPEKYLAECYKNALSLVVPATEAVITASSNNEPSQRVACPLLGAGGRGFPIEVATMIAANSAIQWQFDNVNDNDGIKKEKVDNVILAFGIPDSSIAELLIDAIEEAYKSST